MFRCVGSSQFWLHEFVLVSHPQFVLLNHPHPHPLENYWLLEVIANIQRSCQMPCLARVVCDLQALIAE